MNCLRCLQTSRLVARGLCGRCHVWARRHGVLDQFPRVKPEPVDREMVARAYEQLRDEGLTMAEKAARIGVSRTTLWTVVGATAGKPRRKQLSADQVARLRRMVGAA